MIDFLKKFTNLSTFFEDEVNEELLKKSPLTKEEIYEQLFRNLEAAQVADKRMYFRFARYTDNGLWVKTGGMIAFMPFESAPWKYPVNQYWQYIMPTLTKTRFRCKVIETKRIEDARYEIKVDAGSYPPHSIPLVIGAEHTGIVLEKNEQELLVDIGVHFRWRYGSMMGVLPVAEWKGEQSWDEINVQDFVKLIFIDKNEKGLVFTQTFEDEVPLTIGQIVTVQVHRGENVAPYFMIDGKYKADMPVTKLIYPEKKRRMQKLKGHWADGDLIKCEVLDFKPKRGWVVKCIDEEWLFEVNWCSDEMIDYVGQEVPVFVHKSEEEGTQYLIDNRYVAKFPTGVKTRNLDTLNDGDVIQCRVYSIDVQNQFFRVRWLDANKQ
ncbi:MAG: hypothetical protein LBR66_07335 [Candidatus Symbiothrix sp.]|jgi:ribosomal protein S1|nr:hypothetical protein [Candidatus Symbiothrix sp.]